LKFPEILSTSPIVSRPVRGVEKRVESPIVELRALTKCYGEFTAVADLDLDIGQGELFALLGPNGAGKTTTMRLLMGILRPSRGTARIDGRDCFAHRVEVKRLVGFLPMSRCFMTICEESRLFGSWAGCTA